MATRPRRNVATPDPKVRVEAMVESFERGQPPLMPMVSVKGMSPQFLQLAIDLDVALAKFRDDQSAFTLIRRFCTTLGVELHECPGMVRLDDRRRLSYRQAGDAMRAIDRARAVTAGDRNLKKLAKIPGFCPTYRQTDWESLVDCEVLERRWERSSPARGS